MRFEALLQLRSAIGFDRLVPAGRGQTLCAYNGRGNQV